MYDDTRSAPRAYLDLVDALAPLLDGAALYVTGEAGLSLVRCAGSARTSDQQALLSEMRELATTLTRSGGADSSGSRGSTARGDIVVGARRFRTRAVRLPAITLGRSAVFVFAAERFSNDDSLVNGDTPALEFVLGNAELADSDHRGSADRLHWSPGFRWSADDGPLDCGERRLA